MSQVKNPASTLVELGRKADGPRSFELPGDPLPAWTDSLADGTRATISPGCVIVCSLTVVCPASPRCRLAL
jgi:hypothetical protein